MNNTRSAIPFYFIFFISACISFIWGHKGFAGFDLSPMISANNIALLHRSQDIAVSNPMPPGFVMITYIFTSIFGGKYLSYFAGNIVFCGIIYCSGIIVVSRFRENMKLYALLNMQLLMIVSIGLVTDGHFYISDTSNVYCSFVFFLFEVFVLSANYDEYNKRLLYVLVVSLGYCLFVRQNIGLMTYVLVIVFLVMHLFMVKQGYVHVLRVLFVSLISIVLYAYIIHYVLGVDMMNYIRTVEELVKNRGKLDYRNIYINVDDWPVTGFERTIERIKFMAFLLAFMIFMSVIMLRERVVENGIVLLFLVIPNIVIESVYKYAVIINFLALIILNCLYMYRVGWNKKKINKQLYLLGLIGGGYIIVGLLCMMTNYDMKSSEYPIVMSGIYLYMIIFSEMGALKQEVLRFMVILSVAMWLMFVYEGYERLKILAAGPPSVDGDFGAVINDRYFDSIYSSQDHKEMLESVDNVLSVNKNVFKSGEIMFGARLEYLYAKYKITPPAGLPLWWHYNTSYTKKDIEGIRRVLSNGSIKIIIFGGEYNPDFALMDPVIMRYIMMSNIYRIDRSYKKLIVFQRIK